MFSSTMLSAATAEAPIFKSDSWFSRGSLATRFKVKGLESDPRFFVRAMIVEPSKNPPGWLTRKFYVKLKVSDMSPSKEIWVNISSLSKRLLLSKKEILKAAEKGELEDLVNAQSLGITYYGEKYVEKHLSPEGVFSSGTGKELYQYDELYRPYRRQEGSDQLLLAKTGEEAEGMTSLLLFSLSTKIDELKSTWDSSVKIGYPEKIGGETYLFQPNPLQRHRFKVLRLREDKELGRGGQGVVHEEFSVTEGVRQAVKRALPSTKADPAAKKAEEKARKLAIKEEVEKVEKMHALGLGHVVQALPTYIQVVNAAGTTIAYAGPVYMNAATWLFQEEEEEGEKDKESAVRRPTIGDRLQFCADLMKADMEMWKKNISHGDIKPHNLYLHEGRVIFGDLSGSVDVSSTTEFPAWGTSWTKHYTCEADRASFQQIQKDAERLTKKVAIIAMRGVLRARSVYADGVTMYEALLGRMIDRETELAPDQIRKLLKEAGYGEKVISLITSMLHPDCLRRIRMEDAHRGWLEIQQELDKARKHTKTTVA